MKLLATGVALALVTAAPALAQPAPPGFPAPAGLEIRFCPEKLARSYPLDHARNVHSLLLQGFVVANTGKADATLEAVDIELLRAGEVQDSRRLGPAALATAAKQGAGLKASGQLDMLGFQYCDSRLVGAATMSADAVLQPGEAVLFMWQPFAWRGSRDAVRVSARASGPGSTATGSASIPIDGSPSKTVFHWPLRGGSWLVGAGASFHTTHRWGVPEEFALDIFKVGADGKSRRGNGARHEDFLGYGAEVLAAADGVVSSVLTGQTEDPPLLRKDGEAMEAYMGRIMEGQGARMAKGLDAVIGDNVVIDHGNSEFSVYAHLKPGSIRVKPGQAVKAGEVIGALGSSGNSTEAHLHFQICDRAAALSCAGVVPQFTGIELPAADGPRPLQSGDLVTAQ